jgi:hypothetical protein
MNVVRFAAAGLFLTAASATLINAAESITGRWALDLATCARYFGTAAQSPLIVTDTALRWRDDVCRIERVYKIGDTVHLQANCWGGNGAREIPISLRAHSGRLAVTWNRAATGEMRRCP